MIKSKNEVNNFLVRSLFAVLSYKDEDDIKSKFMLFGHSNDGNFYLYQQREMEEFNALNSETPVGVLIYREEEKLENINHVTIQGTGTLISDLNSDEATEALNTIGVKSPIIKNLADETDRSGFSLIKVRADEISFTSYQELIDGLNPTVLRKK